jgi:hypothetical protein
MAKGIYAYNIYLHEVQYGGGNIGNDLTFEINIESGKKTVKPRVDDKPLSHGKTASSLRELVYAGKTRTSEEIEVEIVVNEKDKISEKGSTKQKFNVDLEKPFGQKETVVVKVKEVGGKKAEAIFTLVFSIEPPFWVAGNSTASCKKGKNDKGVESTQAEVDKVLDYNSQYDGPSEFFVEYTILLNAKGELDKSKSKATFHMINHMAWVEKVGGVVPIDPATMKKKVKLYEYDWKTEAVPIVNVTFAKGDNSTVESFEVKGAKWYPNIGAFKLVDDGVAGTLNIKTKKVSYDAKYYDKEGDGVRSNYHVEGPINNTPIKRPKELDERDRPPYV